MEVPDEETTAAQLLSSNSSIGRKDYDSAAAGSGPTAEGTLEGEAAEAAAAETNTTDSAATTEEAAEEPTQAESETVQSPASNASRPSIAAGDKKIPPGAVRMLSMTTVAEFQKKVAERKGRMTKDE